MKNKQNKIDSHGVEFFDDEERDLHGSLEKGEWKRVPDFEARKKEIEAAARYSVAQRKKKALNLRLGEGDIELIKKKAAHKGLPYQTLISSVIHQYAMDQLEEK
jgi:predicted DNA binding CopG/RHH family protein